MRLGVSQLRQHLLEENSDVLELSEAFGQSEALTVRLKHITGMTPPDRARHYSVRFSWQ